MNNQMLGSVLTGVAVTGVVATSVFTGKAVIKAEQIIKKKKETSGEALTKKEIFKCVAPTFAVPAILGAVTIGAVIGSDVIHTKNYNALLGTYIVTNNALNSYKASAKEILSPEKADELATSSVKKRPTVAVEETGDGDILFIEELTGRQFKSSKEAVLLGEAKINEAFSLSGHVKLNLLYSYWNLRKSEIGRNFVWDDYQMSTDYDATCISFDHIQMEINGETCYLITYPIPPEFTIE